MATTPVLEMEESLAWRITMFRGAWRSTVQGVVKSQTGVSTARSTAIRYGLEAGLTYNRPGQLLLKE